MEQAEQTELLRSRDLPVDLVRRIGEIAADLFAIVVLAGLGGQIGKELDGTTVSGGPGSGQQISSQKLMAVLPRLEAMLPIVIISVLVIAEVITRMSVGKWLFGSIVAKNDGSRASIWRLIGRSAAKFSPLLVLCVMEGAIWIYPDWSRLGGTQARYQQIEFISHIGERVFTVVLLAMIVGMLGIFTRSRRTLHDWIAGTMVADRAKYLRRLPPMGHAFEVRLTERADERP